MEAPGPSRPGGRFAAAALLLAASVLLSRVLGFLRDVVLAAQLGTGAEADAFQAAFQLPDMLNYLLAGSALSIAFIPFYTRIRAVSGSAAAERLVAIVLGTMTVLATAGAVALWLGAEAFVDWVYADFSPEGRRLTTRLTRIVLPAQIFFVTGGIVRAVLMAHDRFATQALAPLLYNLGIIAGGGLFGAALGAEAFAWGALAGAFVGPLGIPLLDARRAGLKLGFAVAPLDRSFLRYLAVAAPLMFGLSLLTVDEWYDRGFGDQLGEGTITRLAFARRLMLLPVGVIGQAIATAALPTLSRLWAEGRGGELDRVLLDTLRSGLGLALIAGAACFALAGPGVEVAFERGSFTRLDSIETAYLLSIFAFGVPAWVVQQIAVRAFYARGDTWRPMLLATGFAIAAFQLYRELGEQLGPAGLALAGALAMSANAVATLLMARLLHGGPKLGLLLLSLLRGLLIAALAAYAALFTLIWRAAAPQALLDLLVAGVVFAAVAGLGIALVGDPPLRRAARSLVARLAGRR